MLARPNACASPAAWFVRTAVPRLLLRARPSVEHPPAHPGPTVSHASTAPSLYCMQLQSQQFFPPNARFPCECAPLMKKWNDAGPACNWCASMPGPACHMQLLRSHAVHKCMQLRATCLLMRMQVGTAPHAC